MDAIKSWNQPFPFLEVGLKQLEAVDFRDPTQAVKTVLELIHVTRMQGDADNYSQVSDDWVPRLATAVDNSCCRVVYPGPSPLAVSYTLVTSLL